MKHARESNIILMKEEIRRQRRNDAIAITVAVMFGIGMAVLTLAFGLMAAKIL